MVKEGLGEVLRKEGLGEVLRKEGLGEVLRWLKRAWGRC